jgi:Domain of unknown function (DUF4342)
MDRPLIRLSAGIALHPQLHQVSLSVTGSSWFSQKGGFGELNHSRARNLDGGHMAFQDFVEEVQVLGRDLVDKIKSLIHEGNVRRIIVRDEQGHTFIEIPVTVAAVGAVLAPVLVAVGAISALVSKFTIVVGGLRTNHPALERRAPGSNVAAYSLRSVTAASFAAVALAPNQSIRVGRQPGTHDLCWQAFENCATGVGTTENWRCRDHLVIKLSSNCPSSSRRLNL